jgi:hypothetical protein
MFDGLGGLGCEGERGNFELWGGVIWLRERWVYGCVRSNWSIMRFVGRIGGVWN